MDENAKGESEGRTVSTSGESKGKMKVSAKGKSE